MPGMNAVGMNTAARMMRDGDDRPGDFLHALERRLLGRQAVLDVVFHDLDDHDGVIHHQADGQHEAEEREGVDGESRTAGTAAKVPTSETGTASSGMSVARQPCRKDEHHDDDQQDRLEQSVLDFLHALRDGQRRVERDHVVQVRREAFLEAGHELLRAGGGLQRVGAGNW
jgi:hypothetical protein